MSIKKVLFTSLVLMLVGVIGCTTVSLETAGDGSAPGLDTQYEVATDFTMSNLAGGETTLSDLRGRYVLVNFWATWCIPCRKEMPYLQQISVDHSEQLIVLGVNLNEEKERVAPFVSDMGLTFPILLNPSDALTAEHNVRGLPVSYVVGPEGKIVYRRIGEIIPDEFDHWLAENLDQ